MKARLVRPLAARRRRIVIAGGLALLALLAGIALFWTAQRVQLGEAQLRHLQAGAADEQESLRVLRAEWDYLNRPDRIEALARARLGMGPAHAGAVGDALPATPPATPPAHGAEPPVGGASTGTPSARRALVRAEPLQAPAPRAAAAPDTRNFHDLMQSLAHDDPGKQR